MLHVFSNNWDCKAHIDHRHGEIFASVVISSCCPGHKEFSFKHIYGSVIDLDFE